MQVPHPCALCNGGNHGPGTLITEITDAEFSYPSSLYGSKSAHTNSCYERRNSHESAHTNSDLLPAAVNLSLP
jgi:hypothetical protein